MSILVCTYSDVNDIAKYFDEFSNSSQKCFSNKIIDFDVIGWGGEDDDFRNRIQDYQVVRFEGHIARYTMLRHKKEIPNPDRFDILKKNVKEMSDELSLRNSETFIGRNKSKEVDGLSNTQYNLISVVKRPLYTHIISDF